MSELTMEYIKEKLPKLGFGIMRLPLIDDNPENIDIDYFKKMVDYYMDNGMNYFDTAYVYHGGQSEKAFKEAVTSRYPREAYTIATKLPVWLIEKPEDMQEFFNTQCTRCGVDYFDFYLLHAMSSERHEKILPQGGFEFMKSLKEQGKAKHIGFSFHGTSEYLDQILTDCPEMEFVQLQINYLDWDDIEASEFYKIARKHNKPIILMEPVKGGLLSNLPKQAADIFKKSNPNVSNASWAIRYCGSLDGIMTILSGMSNMEQMIDNVTTTKNFMPLTTEEYAVIEEVKHVLQSLPTIPCTACKYCIDCPVEIPIFDIFKIYNDFIADKSMFMLRSEYNKIAAEKRADKCIACQKCENVCPQAIDIINQLKYISEVV